MQVALYQGKSGVSRAIRWLTRGPYSHAAFHLDERSAAVAAALARRGEVFAKLQFTGEGAVVEAWSCGVRNVRSLSAQHTPGTTVDLYDLDPPLSPHEEAELLRRLDEVIGTPYDWLDVLYFVALFRLLTGRNHHKTGRLFCSCLLFKLLLAIGRTLFRRTQPWEVPPSWLQRSTGIKYRETVVTT